MPARIAPRTIISPGAKRTVCWLFANTSSIPSPFCLRPVSLSPSTIELPPSALSVPILNGPFSRPPLTDSAPTSSGVGFIRLLYSVYV
ncbi:hypothetical protein EVG64_24660 [Salmonella enterica subsp. enterica serovar Corvallis]|nr:hypothetical protein [Salmonella enterica subsp. enterica serovar Corvallis]